MKVLKEHTIGNYALTLILSLTLALFLPDRAMAQGMPVYDILNSPYIRPEEVDRVTASFEEILERSMESVDYIERILTSDYLKMTDAERATVLKDHEARSDEMVAEVSNRARRYKEIISFRKMQDRINNRETGF